MDVDDQSTLDDEEARRELGWKRLATEVRMFRGESKHKDAFATLVNRAIDGDKGLIQWVAQHTQDCVLDGIELSPPSRFFLVWILERMIVEDEVARGATGTAKPGRSRDGARGMTIAKLVLCAATKSKRMEDAWASVAEECSLSEDMVKRYWIEWKDVALGLFEISPEELTTRMQENRKGS